MTTKRRLFASTLIIAAVAAFAGCAYDAQRATFVTSRGDPITQDSVAAVAGSVGSFFGVGPLAAAAASSVYGIAATVAGLILARKNREKVPYVAATIDLVRTIGTFAAEHPDAGQQLKTAFSREPKDGGQTPETEAVVERIRTQQADA